jgi:3-oxoacyl-[acyl-carrier protein] reductase
MAETSSKLTAIVTGASRGIGRAIAVRLAADGFPVAVNYVGQQAKADEVVAEIVKAGGRAVAIQADVAKSEDARRLFDEAEAALGLIGVLVNSAGVMAMLKIADADEAAFDRMMAINVRGTFNTMKQAARVMGEGGRVINVSSSVVGMKLPAYGPYTATKAAVEMLTRAMAEEMRGRRITVNAVAPGPTETELFFEGKSDELVERMKKLSPMDRLGRPEEIAAVVAFLAGPDGSWVNGQTIRANGGTV